MNTENSGYDSCTSGTFTDLVGELPPTAWKQPKPSDGPPQLRCNGCGRVWVINRTIMADEPDSPNNHDCSRGSVDA